MLFSTAAFAQGTEADARAMLDKTITALKADKAKTLDMINKGEGGFLKGDIYPFCSNVSDDKIVAVANPNAKKLIGTDGRSLKDTTGKAYGEEMYAAASKPEGEIIQVSYMFPKYGPDLPCSAWRSLARHLAYYTDWPARFCDHF
jgi:Single Cache domain 2